METNPREGRKIEREEKLRGRKIRERGEKLRGRKKIFTLNYWLPASSSSVYP
jgi:hypothetical protein